MYRHGPYDLAEYIDRHGDGSNMYRGADFGQPRTLVPGDILANGWKLADKPREGFNGSVELDFTNGKTRFVPARVPLQLQTEGPWGQPIELLHGYILQTGDVVLDTPKHAEPEKGHDYQAEVLLKLTGGFDGHEIRVPADLPLAFHAESYPPNPNTAFGAFVIAQTLEMHKSAREHLPQLGQLALFNSAE